jgi:gliding motility-associated lipoprotein GldH
MKKQNAAFLGMCTYLYALPAMMRHSFIFLLSIALLALAACGPQYLYHEQKTLAADGWAYADTLNFTFSVPDTARRYDLLLEIVHADTFSTQNVYLQLHTRFPAGKRLQKIKSFDLFDAQGRSNGTCSGQRCTLQAVLQENTYFNQPGEYVLTIGQHSRQEHLRGLHSIRFMLAPAAVQ